ncbi:transmembrane protein 186 [Discoglossus pictus]
MSVRLRYLLRHLPLRKSHPFCRTILTGCGKNVQPNGEISPRFLLQANRAPWWLPTRHFSSLNDGDKFNLIYRFPGIYYCRVISRLKLLQTTLTFVILPPVYYYYFQGQVTYSSVVYCTGTTLFAGVMLYCLSFYLRRLIGMMYLNSTGTILKISHLTFWGKRRDIFIPVEDVKTMSETGDTKQETVLQLQRYSTQDVLYFTTRFGRVLDRERFVALFGRYK